MDLGARDLEPEVGEVRVHALLARRAPQERPGLVGREVRDDELAAGLELRGPLREDARPVLARALAEGLLRRRVRGAGRVERVGNVRRARREPVERRGREAQIDGLGRA